MHSQSHECQLDVHCYEQSCSTTAASSQGNNNTPIQTGNAVRHVPSESVATHVTRAVEEIRRAVPTPAALTYCAGMTVNH